MEYITRESVIELLNMLKERACKQGDSDAEGAFMIARNVISGLASIYIDDGAIVLSKEAYCDLCSQASESTEAEEIVHCGECKYFQLYGGKYDEAVCDGICRLTDCGEKSIDYCSDGEREQVSDDE